MHGVLAMRQFELTADHLTLLKNACVGWQGCETGAPEIDPKRPYGNSSVWRDVAEILGKPLPEEGDESASADELEHATRVECERLHRETETALEIVLSAQTFVPGRYALSGGVWRIVEVVPDGRGGSMEVVSDPMPCCAGPGGQRGL